jgi:hypothetical protein
MDDVKYVIGVDDTDIVKTLLNHKKLVKENCCLLRSNISF